MITETFNNPELNNAFPDIIRQFKANKRKRSNWNRRIKIEKISWGNYTIDCLNYTFHYTDTNFAEFEQDHCRLIMRLSEEIFGFESMNKQIYHTDRFKQLKEKGYTFNV